MAGDGVEEFHAVAVELGGHREGGDRTVQLGHHDAHGGHAARGHALTVDEPPFVEVADGHRRQQRGVELPEQFRAALAAAHHQPAVGAVNDYVGMHGRDHAQLFHAERADRIDVESLRFERFDQRGHVFLVGVLHVDVARQQRHARHPFAVASRGLVEALVVVVGGEELVLAQMEVVVRGDFDGFPVRAVEEGLAVDAGADVVQQAAVVAHRAVLHQCIDVGQFASREGVDLGVVALGGIDRHPFGDGAANGVEVALVERVAVDAYQYHVVGGDPFRPVQRHRPDPDVGIVVRTDQLLDREVGEVERGDARGGHPAAVAPQQDGEQGHRRARPHDQLLVFHFLCGLNARSGRPAGSGKPSGWRRVTV